MDLEGSAVGHEAHDVCVFFLRQDMKDFLGEVHVFNLGGERVTSFGWDSRPVTVGVVDMSSRLADRLDNGGQRVVSPLLTLVTPLLLWLLLRLAIGRRLVGLLAHGDECFGNGSFVGHG